MNDSSGERRQFCTVLCPSCGLVWTMDRLAPGACPDCSETHVVFRGKKYHVEPALQPRKIAS